MFGEPGGSSDHLETNTEQCYVLASSARFGRLLGVSLPGIQPLNATPLSYWIFVLRRLGFLRVGPVIHIELKRTILKHIANACIFRPAQIVSDVSLRAKVWSISVGSCHLGALVCSGNSGYFSPVPLRTGPLIHIDVKRRCAGFFPLFAEGITANVAWYCMPSISNTNLSSSVRLFPSKRSL